MLLTEKEIKIDAVDDHIGLREYLSSNILKKLKSDEIPIRFTMTRMDRSYYECELGLLSDSSRHNSLPRKTIFEFSKRKFENTSQFNAVLLVPTGIGAELGGHSGDAGPLSRLLAQSCDKLITHPNVVNASDINELPENGLYVEGSIISRLLMGSIGLQEARSNRVIVILDEHDNPMIHELALNSVSAARTTMGIECPLVVIMRDRVIMRAFYVGSGRAAGRVEHFDRLCGVLDRHIGNFDAVALSTLINVPSHYHADYFKRGDNEMVNPWGGVEAILTHSLSLLYDLPSAHSPMINSKEVMDLDVGVVDPRKSAEAVSNTYLHCVLKGLHNSPRIVRNPPQYSAPGILTTSDISCLIIPNGCIGLPTLAALEQGIPVIAVKENMNRMKNNLEDLPFSPGKLFIVENYLEAIGVMAAIKAGVSTDSVRRPMSETAIEHTNSSILRHDSKIIE